MQDDKRIVEKILHSLTLLGGSRLYRAKDLGNYQKNKGKEKQFRFNNLPWKSFNKENYYIPCCLLPEQNLMKSSCLPGNFCTNYRLNLWEVIPNWSCQPTLSNWNNPLIGKAFEIDWIIWFVKTILLWWADIFR